MGILTIFIVEALQNIPFVFGGVIGLYGWHKGQIWSAIASIILGSLGSAWLIILTESAKLNRTTLTIGHNPLPLLQGIKKLLVMAGLFSIGFLLICIYLEQAWADWKTDLLIIAGLATIASLTQVILPSANKVPRLRILTHTLSFIVAGMAILPMMRFAMWTSDTLGEPILWVAPITLIMSLLITIVDYAPFLKRE